MRTWAVVALIIASSVASEARAARMIQPSEANAFKHLDQVFGGLRDRLPAEGPRGPIALGYLSDMDHDSKSIRRYLKTWEPPDDYIQSLNDVAEALETRIHSEVISDDDMRLLKAAQADLEAKRKSGEANSRRHKNPMASIAVTAQTMSHGAEVGECRVHYVLRVWADDAEHEKEFRKLSSPTTASMPPGAYFVWALHDGTPGEQLSVDAGADGQPQAEIQLVVAP